MAKIPNTPRSGRRATVTATATDAAKNFGQLVDRVRDTGVACVVERKGRPIARIAPIVTHRCTVGDLARWFALRRDLPSEYTTAVRRHVKAMNQPRVPVAGWEP